MAKPRAIYVVTGKGGDVLGIGTNVKELMDECSSVFRNTRTKVEIWSYQAPVLIKTISPKK